MYITGVSLDYREPFGYIIRIPLGMYKMMTTTTPKKRKAPPKWALALKLRRTELGKTQDDIVAESNDLMTQAWVTDIERGRTDLLKAGMEKVVALARALEWSLEDMQEATGLDLGMAVLKPKSIRFEPVYLLSEATKSQPRSEGSIVLQDSVNPPRFRVFIMEGDEMVSSLPNVIHPGYSVYTDLDSVRPIEGKDYVIVYEGVAHVRTFTQTPLGPAFAATNPTHPLIPATANVVGRVYRRVGVQDDLTLN